MTIALKRPWFSEFSKSRPSVSQADPATGLPTERRTVLILGATSDIARATAHAFAASGARIVLAARNGEATLRDAADLSLRHRVEVRTETFDVLDPQTYSHLLDHATLPDVVVCAVGMLGVQKESESDPALAARVMRSNFEGPACLLGLFAEAFAQRGSGTIIGVSSVAGDRGRGTNYVYGSAKAGLTAFLSGLRSRFADSDIRVVTIKPGFVDTRMTEGFDTPLLLTAKAEDVAKAIERASRGGPDVVYVSRIWSLIMTAISILPEAIFKRLSF